MNGYDLLDLLGGTKDTYIVEAQKHRRSGHEVKIMNRHKTKPLLIAALIGLMIVLMGCALVALNLQDMKIAEETGTRNFDEAGQHIEPTEVTRDVISIRGYKGSQNQLATQEWYEFEIAYDPDDTLLYANAHNESGIPEAYQYPYGCYTWEMVEKVDEIAQKYGLKLLSPEIVVQRWQARVMFDALGIDGVCHADRAASVNMGAGYFYPEGNFKYDFAVLLDGEEAWPYEIWLTMLYSRKEYFDPDYHSMDTELYEQWNYTTADGTEVLIAMSGNGAIFFAEQEDSYITLLVNTTPMLPADETRRAGKQDYENLAEVIDFSIRPQTVDVTDIQEKLDQAEMEYEQQKEETARKAAQGYDSYAAYIQEKYIDGAQKLAGTPYVRNYYALWDVTGDGVDDLLLGSESDHFRDLLTIWNGKVTAIVKWRRMTLCENNVIQITGLDHLDRPVSYTYFTADSNGLTMVDGVYYDPETDTWSIEIQEYIDDAHPSVYETITEEQAKEIMDKYVPVGLEMKPISQFPMT